MASELRALSDVEANAEALENLLVALGMRGQKARRLALLGAVLATTHLPQFAPLVEADDA